MKTRIAILVILFTISLSGFSQNQKMKETAMEKVEELNSEIIAGDKNLALNQNQKDKIYELHLARMKEAQTARKNGSDKEDIKEINKKYFQQIYNDVLTKEQKKARRAGKDDGED